jgi:hypothetical protein
MCVTALEPLSLISIIISMFMKEPKALFVAADLALERRAIVQYIGL